MRTGAAGVSFINDSNASTGVLAFIQKLRFQYSPATVEHGFGHARFGKLAGADIADEDGLIPINHSP